MHFNAEREPTKYELEAIEAIRQSHINLPTQDFQKTKLWSEKLKAGQYEVKPESVCNCTATERMFLDEIREKFMVCDDGSLGLKSEDYSSMLDQSDFKTSLKEMSMTPKQKLIEAVKEEARAHWIVDDSDAKYVDGLLRAVELAEEILE